MNNELKTTFQEISGFIAIWYVFFCTTYGVWVPSGLFLPGIIIGCAIGQLYWQIYEKIFVDSDPNADQSYKVMAASAMLGGYTRLTYSLCVIMLETTQSINYFIPIMISVLTSVTVGDLFNRSLYERALRAKQIPLLRNFVPKSQRDTTAFQIMSHNPTTVEGIIAVTYLTKLLQSGFSTFPVMNSAGNIVGVIPKNFIIVLIENHHWVDVNQLDSYQKSKLPKMFRRSSSDLQDEMGPGAPIHDDDWFQEKDFRGEEGKDPLLPKQVSSEDSHPQSPEQDRKIGQNLIDASYMRESMERESLTLAKRGTDFNTSMSVEVEKRKKTLQQFTGLSDAAQIPATREELPWHHFNSDFYSNDREYAEVADICDMNSDKMIDVRPYMIETPWLAQSTDRLQKINDMFRHMHLRMLAVTNPGTGALEGIITRQDLFAFMSL